MSAAHLGDYAAGETVYVTFNTNDATGAPITLAGTPTLCVYKLPGTTQSTSGVGSVSVDFDGVTGLHVAAIDTSASSSFYANGEEFAVTIAAGTVSSISVVGEVVGRFSVGKQIHLDAGTIASATDGTTFTSTSTTLAAYSNAYNNAQLEFRSGANRRMRRTVTSSTYSAGTTTFVMGTAFPSTPAAADPFFVG